MDARLRIPAFGCDVRDLTRDLQSWFRRRQLLLLVLGALSAAASLRHAEDVAWNRTNSQEGVARVLRARGLVCAPGDVAWVIGPKGVAGAIRGGARAIVRAHVGDEPNDIYWVDARLAPGGALLEVRSVWKLTDTSGADESLPVLHGHLAAHVAMAESVSTGVHVLDLDGRTLNQYPEFTRTQRLEVALTNLEQTGQIAGVVNDTYAFDPVSGPATLTWRDDGQLAVHTEDRDVTIEPRRGLVTDGGELVRVVRDERARPGSLATWAVDRVRSLSWFGDDRMQWLKAVVYTVLDRYRAHFAQYAQETTAEQVRDELGIRTPDLSISTSPVGDGGFPPPPMKPLASSPLPGEGLWISLDRDPFITRAPDGTAPTFVASFLRPDPHRSDVRVYITLWDPRQVALHMQAGTIEPVSASGECGLGTVPRTPAVMKRLVAAFNGGFQARHGEFGMQVDGVEYLPPKPYAATIGELTDGSNGFGSWPGPEASASGGDFVSLRQNLTALVQDEKFNPWQRSWWGGTPPGWPDRIHSARSGLCLTREGFVGYFYGGNIAAEDLGGAMIAARCNFGVHLDMNPGHVGFEFYNVAPQGRLAPLEHPLRSDSEAEGAVPDMVGLTFRARRMVRGMGSMLFPRYLQRQARDFFYLTARPVLPGAPIDVGPAAAPGEGQWNTKGLPHYGQPFALATSWVCAPKHEPAIDEGGASRPPSSSPDAGGAPRPPSSSPDAGGAPRPSSSSPDAGGAPRPSSSSPDGGCVRLRIVRVDPRTVRPESSETSDSPTVIALSANGHGPQTLWWKDGALSIDGLGPGPHSTAIVAGVAMSAPAATTASAVVGIQDEDGMLAWVELPPDVHPDARTAAAMDEVLGRLGCTARLALPGEGHALLGGSLDASGDRPAPQATVTVRLVRGRAPDAHRIFEGTPVVPFEVWQPLQAKRVRYMAKPPTSSGEHEGGREAPPSSIGRVAKRQAPPPAAPVDNEIEPAESSP